MSGGMVPAVSSVSEKGREGVAGRVAARTAPLGAGFWKRTMSSRRVSSEATSPVVRVKVSVTWAWTTVPEGSGVGGWTARATWAEPPVGGIVGGVTTVVATAAGGTSTVGSPARGGDAPGYAAAQSRAATTTAYGLLE